jgi:division protein CdvB (Snf7/Vps24/ESCRT-III family)
MSFLFGGARPSGADALKQYQRDISGQARAIEREISRLNQQERVITQELTKLGKANKMDLATLKARELIRMRAHRKRLYVMKSHMSGLAQQLQSVGSTGKIHEIVAKSTHILQCINSRLDAVSVQKMLAEFEKQNIIMASKQEITEDGLDEAFETDGEQDATEDAVITVMQEIGLDLTSYMASRAQASSSNVMSNVSMEELEERLQNLKTP